MKKVKIIIALVLFVGYFKAQHQFTNYGNLNIHPGTSVTVVGNFINNGLLVDSGSVISFAGSGPQEIGGTSASTFKNVVLNNTAGSFLSANVNISKELNIVAGTFSSTGYDLKLLSDQNGTARIAPILGDFNGNITMQRYLPPGSTGWRFLAAPVTGATLNDWQDNFITSGYSGSTYPAFTFTSIYTYDETVTGISDNGYNGATNATNSIVPGVGYWCYVGPVPLTVDLTGPPVKFNQTFSVSYTPSGGPSEDGYVMIGNPYPSAIDWSSGAWTKNNINNAIYIWNPALEQYGSWVSGTSTNGGSNFIASSQSFWIQTNGTGPSLSCTENIKVSSDPVFLKPSSTPFFDQLRLTIKGNSYKDETLLRFGNGASNGYDTGEDARKLFSSSPQVPGISTQDSTQKDMSINSLPPVNSSIHVPVKTIVGITGNYTISVDSSSSALPSGYCIVLEDLVTGIQTTLNNFSEYSFTIADTTKAARFLLHITAPHHTEAISATCNQRHDGKAIAQGTGTGPWNYIWLTSSNTSLKQTFNAFSADTLHNLPAGNYFVKVSAVNGSCSYFTSQITISEPLPVYAGFTFLKDTVFTGMKDGLVIQNTSVGATSYRWDFGDGSPIDSAFTPANHSYNSPGNYKISLVARKNNCSDTLIHEITVISNDFVGLTENESATKVLVFPNPGRGIFYVKLGDEKLINGEVEVITSSGQRIYKSLLVSEKTEIDLQHAAKGIYFYSIRFKNSRSHGKLIIE